MTKPLDELENAVQRLSQEMARRHALDELAMERCRQTGYTTVVSFADAVARRRAKRLLDCEEPPESPAAADQ